MIANNLNNSSNPSNGSSSKIELHVDVEASTKAVDLLAANCSLSKQRLKQVMSKGAVWLTHEGKTSRLRRATKVLQPAETVHLYYDVDVLDAVPPTPLLMDDRTGYSVWHKPGGLLSQGSKWGDHCTITRWAEQNLTPQRNSFIIHRLDRAATGLILVGHSKKVTAQLCDLFQQRQLDKRYLVIVHGEFAPQTTLDTPVDGKAAISHGKLRQYDPAQNRSLVEVKIETGRKHQIRVHMAGAGHPVVGDRLHGLGNEKEDLQLTAYQLSFCCPVTKQPVKFELPESLWPKLS
ncbi:MAG: tRNA pseudouridine32 synthase/23S rRNA pseudouridine746 synthase [Phenylobacterium sp.]